VVLQVYYRNRASLKEFLVSNQIQIIGMGKAIVKQDNPSCPDLNDVLPELGFQTPEFAMFIQKWTFPR